jgi:FkbM family methyltransferase
MRTIAILFTYFGKILGKIFRLLLPHTAKRAVAISLEKMISITSGRFSSLLYIVAYEIVKHMYFATREIVVITKIIFQNLRITLNIVNKTQRILFLQKIYEPYITNYLLKYLKNGDVFLDIGANVGYYTLLASKLVGKEGKVIAFEPEEENFSSLFYNVAQNGLENVTCVKKGIGKENKTATFNVNPLNDGGGSLATLNSYNDDKEKWTPQKIKKYFPHTILQKDIEVISIDEVFSNKEEILSKK